MEVKGREHPHVKEHTERSSHHPMQEPKHPHMPEHIQHHKGVEHHKHLKQFGGSSHGND